MKTTMTSPRRAQFNWLLVTTASLLAIGCVNAENAAEDEAGAADVGMDAMAEDVSVEADPIMDDAADAADADAADSADDGSVGASGGDEDGERWPPN